MSEYPDNGTRNGGEFERDGWDFRLGLLNDVVVATAFDKIELSFARCPPCLDFPFAKKENGLWSDDPMSMSLTLGALGRDSDIGPKWHFNLADLIYFYAVEYCLAGDGKGHRWFENPEDIATARAYRDKLRTLADKIDAATKLKPPL